MGAVAVIKVADMQQACLQRGYPHFNFTITGEVYCTTSLTAVAI
jgi:hypothetical protein